MQGSLLSNADEGDTGTIEDFDEGADVEHLRNMGIVEGASIAVLFARAGAVKILINDKITQSLSKELAETVILES